MEILLLAMPKTPDHRITIRLKPDEYAVLTAKAGKKPLSTFMRDLALEKAVQKRRSHARAPITDHKASAQILGLLGQHDLVQAFKNVENHISDGVEPADDETKLLLRRCHELLSRIHNLLMRALGVTKR